MKKNAFLKEVGAIASQFRITSGHGFRLKDHDPDETLDFKHKDKPRAQRMLVQGVQELSELQNRLYADNSWGLLGVFQAMDAAGKDSAIKHVMSGVNPQGCQVVPFKAPTSEELDHDFMWRCSRAMPGRGMIGIFNRSYYEEVLVVSVHPEFLKSQRIPGKLVTGDIWKQRYRAIRDYERYLTENGFVVCKFFLNVSKREQGKRFIERLEDPAKNWKFSATDIKERGHWDAYQRAYEKMIRHTATTEAPWYVIPADHKWFTRLAVAAVLVDTLHALNPQYPKVPKDAKKGLQEAKAVLIKQSPKLKKED